MVKKIDRNIYFLFSIFLLTNLFLFLRLGIVTSNEAEKYITQAELVLKGQFPSSTKYFYYLPIILLIAFAKKYALGYGFVVVFQVLFAFLGLIGYYKGSKIIFNKQVALISSILLCLFFPFFSWNFFLYSESIFITLSLILYYFVCKFETQQTSILLLLFGCLMAMIFSRPFGVLFIPPLFAYFVFSKYKSTQVKILTFALSLLFLVLMLFFINKIFHGGEDMDAMKPFKEEHIICFVPQNPNGAALNLKYYDNGIKDIAYYISHNPSHFLKLMAKRLYSFFSLTRPWYSNMHNLILSLFIIPVYLFFLAGAFFSFPKKNNSILYLLSLIILYPLAATFQCDDWSGRFTMLVIPPIFSIATFGCLTLLNGKTN